MLLAPAFFSYDSNKYSTINTMSIVALNNHGVGLLQQGKHMTALAKFRSALDTLKERIDEEVSTEASDDQGIENQDLSETSLNSASSGTTTTSSSCSSVRLGVPPYRIQVDNSTANTTEASASPHNVFCLYSHAFEFPAEQGDTEGSDTSRTSTFPDQLDASTVLLFNIAITYHLQGLQTSADKSSNCLNTALSIYKMIDSLLLASSESTSEENNNNASLKIFRMAVYSNMGHIHSHFFVREEETRCREMIFRLLFVLTITNNSCAVLWRRTNTLSSFSIPPASIPAKLRTGRQRHRKRFRSKFGYFYTNHNAKEQTTNFENRYSPLCPLLCIRKL